MRDKLQPASLRTILASVLMPNEENDQRHATAEWATKRDVLEYNSVVYLWPPD